MFKSKNYGKFIFMSFLDIRKWNKLIKKIKNN